jgi:two-component system chemotaxis sensor kinase CheA
LSSEILGPIRELFFHECEDLLAELEAGLLALQRGAADAETINSVFRAVHSIKGSAGAFDLDALVAFAHRFESVLARLRSGALPADADLLKLLLRAADVIADLVRKGREGEVTDPEYGADVAEALGVYAGDVKAEGDEILDFDFDFTPRPIEISDAEPSGGLRTWTLRLKPDAGLYGKGGELLPLLRELKRLGEVQIALDDRDVPLICDLHPEKAYLSWTVTLATEADEQSIREVFAFVEGDCDIHLSVASDPLVDETQPAAPASTTPAAFQPPRPASVGETVRVDLERLDKLVNLVGELLINQSMLAQRLSEAGYVAAAGADMPIDEVQRLTRELQDGVMAIRAQPVRVVFQRMPRLVRELESVTGKQVDLIITGESSEVDRTVIERLSDPLIHMVRNAVDHGIESPERRAAVGKPVRGSLRLSAAHRAGRIVIDVSDDGAGIDRERVRRIAIERGLIQADAVLSNDETDMLIFAPGFSTASVLSGVSGRGVGMDVVKRGVEALGGRISFTSQPGAGSTFSLSLPLTLAVLDGMAISVCDERFIVALSALVEAVQVGPQDISALGPDARLLNFRGRRLPLFDLGAVFGYRPQPVDSGVALVVEGDTGGPCALLVDTILGQRQVVIRSLEANYRAVEGVAAATILGDGRVAFILDIHAILASQRRETTDSNP